MSITKEELERIKTDRKKEQEYICQQPFKSHVIDQLIEALEQAWREIDARELEWANLKLTFLTVNRELDNANKACEALRIEKAGFHAEVATLLGRLAKESQDHAVERDALLAKVALLEEQAETLELGYRGFP